jgi:hypothetical protein
MFVSLRIATPSAAPPNPNIPITHVFRVIVEELEQLRPTGFSVMHISRQYGIPHRRAYDFFNLLSSLGVCAVVERTRMRWCGLNQIPICLAESYSKFEPGPSSTMAASLFVIDSSPTLGILASRFIFMYLYHGFEVLAIRDAMHIFCNSGIDRKSLERRLYLVLSFLNVIRVVDRAQQPGHYRLLLNRTQIVGRAVSLKFMQDQRDYDSTITALLNRPSGPQMEQVYQRRRAEFFALVGQ